MKLHEPMEELFEAVEAALKSGGSNVMGGKVYDLPTRMRSRLKKALGRARAECCELCYRKAPERNGCENCAALVCESCTVAGPDGETRCVACD